MMRSPLKRKPASRSVRVCVDCGRPISAKSTGRCKRCANIVNGLKGAAVTRASRVEVARTCANCGVMFTTRGSRSGRFCSQRCMGEAKRKPRICTVCGGEFWARAFRAKTCSPECLRVRKREIGRAKGKPHPTGNTRKRWLEARGDRCEVCGATRALHFHHVIYEQHLKLDGGDPYDPANGMTVCQSCHRRHHDAVRRIPFPNVPDAASDFAIRLLGPDRAALYFARFYAPEVPEGHGRWEP